MIRLQDIDLNLLVVFEQLLEERQVSSVARKLRRSQPAVSNALVRLRRAFDDPLFVRTAEGMQPTPLARQLAEPITVALSRIAGAVNYRERFEPRTSRRAFSIATSELGEIDLIPPLANRCHSLAPGLKLRTVRASEIDLVHEVEAGRIDLVLGAFEEISQGLLCRRLFRQSYATLYRKGHALGRGEPTLKDFASARHLFISTATGSYASVNRALERAGVLRGSTLETPFFTAVPYLIQATDCVATVPSRFAATAAAPFGLGMLTPPLRLPMLEISVLWHPRFEQDEGNRWLRAQIVELFAAEGAARQPSRPSAKIKPGV